MTSSDGLPRPPLSRCPKPNPNPKAPTPHPYPDLPRPVLVQDLIEAKAVPIGSPPVVPQFIPELVPRCWAADVVARDLAELDKSMADGPGQLSEGTVDELQQELQQDHEQA